VHAEVLIDSVRITREYRALGVWDGEAIVRVEAITLLFAPYRRRRGAVRVRIARSRSSGTDEPIANTIFLFVTAAILRLHAR